MGRIATDILWVTHPNIAQLLYDPSDGYKYTYGSNAKVDWQCNICGNIVHNKPIAYIARAGLSCNICGDGISYPEKFFSSFLNILGIDYIYQLTRKHSGFEWCNNFRYDFYILELNCIIETHGGSHYNGRFFTKGGRDLKDEVKNDVNKKDLAMKNGIDKYIIINCMNSDPEWIKKSIICSELSDLFDLNMVDWNIVGKYALNSKIQEACIYYNSNILMSIHAMSENLKLSMETMHRYLTIGNSIGLCSYNPKEHLSMIHRINDNLLKSLKQNSFNMQRKVKCLTTDEIFDSVKDGANFCKLKYMSSICACCRGKYKTAGKHPMTGERLVWQYV
jgi:hypothetical protein